jgi:hypothetical protein
MVTLDTGEEVHYIKPGGNKSPNNIGGYIVYYPRDVDEAYFKFYFTDYDLFSPNWANAFLQFVYFNRNTKMLILNTISFSKSPSGEIKPKYYSEVGGHYYETPFDIFRGCLEVIFLIMTTWYLYFILKELLFCYINVIK